MEKKTIWYTPQEKIPEENKRIIFYAGGHDYLCWGVYKGVVFLDDPYTIHQIEWELEQVSKWAYLDDLIATSKALDVAISRFKALNQAKIVGDVTDIVLGYKTWCSVTLNEISEIMKGGK